jgi:peptide/nickel transport system permease protein
MDAAEPPKPHARPHPRLDQMKRTWYFFRRNTLAVIGLGIVLAIVGVAAYGATQNYSWYAMQPYCLSDYGPGNTGSGWFVYNQTYHYWQGGGPLNTSVISDCNPVCTYEVTPPPDASAYCGGQWYKTPITGDPTHCPNGYFTPTCPPVTYPALLGPTLNFQTLNPGAQPLGVLGLSESAVSVYSIYNSLLRGADWSLTFAVSIVGLGAAIGLVVGAVAGFFGGIIDDVLMRLVDIFLSIPVILFVIVLITLLATLYPNGVFGMGPTNSPLILLILGFAIVWWPLYSRIVRGQVLVVRELKFVEAARANGASKARILFRHIIPNSVQPIFIQFSLDVGSVPLLIGSLQFLGFGPELFPVQSQGFFPEWGAIAAMATASLPSDLSTCTGQTGCLLPWWQLFFPGLALFAFAISVNLLADGLRDALDPRLLR